MMYVFAIIISYLLGSIPMGLVFTRMMGKGDLRKVGSGNIGATNVMRVGGLRMAGHGQGHCGGFYRARRWW